MSNFELPFGTQFSPNKVYIMDLLPEIEKCNGKSTDTLIEILKDKFFYNNAKNSRQTMANNCKNSLVAYGILQSGGGINFTDYGKSLLGLTKNQVYDSIAKHILTELNGMTLIDSIRTLVRNGKRPTNEEVIDTLNKLGCNISKTANNVQVMKLWLEKAGVLNGWNIVETKIQQITGYAEAELALFKQLRPEQYYFLRALCNTGSEEFQKATEIKKLAIATFAISFPEKAFSTQVLNPLEEKGLIEKKKTSEGRGGNTPLIKVTELTKKDMVIPLLNQMESFVGKEILEYFQKTLQKLRRDIDSDDTYTKGLALEAFTIKVMSIIGMEFVETRLKGNETGGAEVDVIFDSTRLQYSRWQVQCKNTKTVSLDQVAKEVGLSHVLKSNTIVIMTTGKVSGSARGYANKIMKEMNLCIYIVEGNDIEAILNKPANIIEVFNREALNAKNIKVL